MNLTAIRSATLMWCVLAAAAHAADMTIHSTRATSHASVFTRPWNSR